MMNLQNEHNADARVPVDPLVRRLRDLAAAKHDDLSIGDDAADAIVRLRDAIIELRDRIKDHPAYAELTMDQEIEVGGDTAELSYLARVADDALDA
jgi:hypothetical protein